jgi:hypothetical protein
MSQVEAEHQLVVLKNRVKEIEAEYEQEANQALADSEIVEYGEAQGALEALQEVKREIRDIEGDG